MANLADSLSEAIEHHRSGRLQNAEQLYRQILAADPDQPDALHLLGVIAMQVGRHDDAIQLIGSAIRVHGGEAAFHNNLAESYRASGRIAEATASYQRAIELRPEFAEAHNGLGVALQGQGRNAEAVASYQRALALMPTLASAQFNLGTALDGLGQTADAIAAYRHAVELKPDFAEAHNNLGTALKRSGRLDEAINCFWRASQAAPHLAEAAYNLGNALKDAGRMDEAIAWYQRATQVRPDYAAAHSNLGSALLATGRSAEAAACFRKAVELSPGFAQAHYNLGTACQELGQGDEAIAAFERAIELEPNYAAAYNNLGSSLQAAGRIDEAIARYRRAIELMPELAEAHYNLGTALQAQEANDEAIACYERAVQLRPDYAEAYGNLGAVLQARGETDRAIACYREAVHRKPSLAEAHHNLAAALCSQGAMAEAVAAYRQATALKPDSFEAQLGLGSLLKELGQIGEAIACFDQALRIKPDSVDAHLNRGIALQIEGRISDARAAYQQALEHKPDSPQAHNNLGNAIKDEGKPHEALPCYRRALEIDPDYTVARDNLLMTLQYCDGVTPAGLAEEHAEYERQHALPLRSAWQPHANVRDPERPLRLGFVSGDLGRHPVGSFLIQAFENLDRRQYEAFCYSDRLRPDEVTARFKAAAAGWHEIATTKDELVDELIRADKIDILFDLVGHTAHNRLLVFARKPAPIQISWIGYEGTTGLSAIDYLLADRHEIPPSAESFYREKVLRLPDSYVCYDRPGDAPAVADLAADRWGHVTFASFNNQAKITPRVAEVWARILARVPQSRLVLKYSGMSDPAVSGYFTRLFAAQGIDESRLLLIDRSPYAGYFSSYGEVDIALDPFPFAGGITSCHAMWMGVPVITCPGETFASRHGLSYLSAVGFTETIARDLDEYVEMAVGLAGDLPRLRALRSSLRERMAGSPLCDGKRFAANLMALLREVWRQWCNNAQSG
jgi:protein O-GlcNAc transferase